MATFYNQATLSYNNAVKNSNVVSGELVEVLSMTKTGLNFLYNTGDTITYILSIVNSGNTAFTSPSVTDNLGTYAYGTEDNLTPLTFVDDSVRYIINGVPQEGYSATATGNSVTFTGFTIPANGTVVIAYEVKVNGFAPVGGEGKVTNTATLTASGLSTPVAATYEIDENTAPNLSILKSVSPVPVSENGQLTYTFTIQNTSSTGTATTDTVVLSDTFDPILTDITVTVDGTQLTAEQYSYDDTTGEFSINNATLLAVPAATYEQDAVTGEYIINPGKVTVTITGTV